MGNKTTILPDGSLLFRTGSQVPIWLDGYIQDKSNKNLFHPDFLSCIHKESNRVPMACGNCKVTHFCKLFQFIVTPANCESCNSRKLP